jgi:hypothetical protein
VALSLLSPISPCRGARNVVEPRVRRGRAGQVPENTLLLRDIRLKKPASRISPPARAPHFIFLMKVRFFVTGTAALLAVWLVATFVNQVPVDRYPQFGRGSVPVSAKALKPKEQAKPVASIDLDEAADVAIE